MSNKISVVIIAGNEEQNIYDCLKSVEWADEVIVVDSESTDDTVKIAKEFTDKIFIKKWMGFSKQKDYAVSLARNNWVLSLDADERIPPKLADEILNSSLEFDGYLIGRENYFIGKAISTCGWENDYQLRLFKKSNTTITDRLVHEGFVSDGKTAKLKNKMVHLTYNSIESALAKINHYSDLKATEDYERKTIGGLGILLHSVSAFLRFFISYKGYKDGVYGMIISFFNSITSMLSYTKIWELNLRKQTAGEKE